MVPTRASFSIDLGVVRSLRAIILKQNAFSVRLSEHGFDYHGLFVPDLLHEFELGTWKATFTHLIRVLRANRDGLIQDLNWRFGVLLRWCDCI